MSKLVAAWDVKSRWIGLDWISGRIGWGLRLSWLWGWLDWSLHLWLSWLD